MQAPMANRSLHLLAALGSLQAPASAESHIPISVTQSLLPGTVPTECPGGNTFIGDDKVILANLEYHPISISPNTVSCLAHAWMRPCLNEREARERGREGGGDGRGVAVFLTLLRADRSFQICGSQASRSRLWSPAWASRSMLGQLATPTTG